MILSENFVSTIPQRMGRQALNMKATQIRLPEALMQRVDAAAGIYRRAQFIRDAIEARLDAEVEGAVASAAHPPRQRKPRPDAKLKRKGAAPASKTLSPGRASQNL